MALLGASSAMGETTALCKVDALGSCSQAVTHTHYDAENIEILTGAIDYKCDALYLANVYSLGSPQVLEGEFTYTNCNHECTRTEENGPVVLHLLKTGHETAELTGTAGAGVLSECPEVINCVYSFQNLVATVKGPLLSKATNGEFVYESQPLTSAFGFLCPSTPKLDARFILTSAKAYISS